MYNVSNSTPHDDPQGSLMAQRGPILWSVLLFQLGFAVWSGWDATRQRWLSDDAFISFRYAKNWSEGHGLVYNVGESVEGYTNLLWTVWIGLGMSMGLQPEWFAHLSSLGAYSLMLALLLRFHHKGASLPLVVVAGMYHIRSFATSGLETQLFLTSIVLFIWALKERRWKVLWTAMTVGLLTRPEGGLLWLAVLPVLWLYGRRQVALYTGLLGLGVLGGLEVWRLMTYGEWLPNTYYAKAQSAQWAQGWLYVRLFFQMYWFVPFGWLAGVALFQRGAQRNPHREWVAFSLLFSTLYALHVLRVGGDFMMARFALPWAVPLVMLLGTWVQERFFGGWKSLAVLVLTGGVSLTAIAPSGLTSIDKGAFGIQGITEESHWYTEEWRLKAQQAGQSIEPLLKDTDIQVVIYGAQAMFAYYANLPYALEGMTGLTDRELARLPSRDGRVGHGRKATVPYLQARGVDLYIDFRLQQGSHPLNQIHLGGLSGSILSYKKEHMALLRQRGAEFQDFEEYLDWYIETLSTKNDADIERDVSVFEQYYFQFNDDPVDQERWRQLQSKDR